MDASLIGETPGEQLDSFLKGVLEYQRNRGFSGGRIFGNIASEMSDRDKHVSIFLNDLFEEWIEKIRVVVKAAQKTGEVAADVSAEVLAKHIIMVLEGGHHAVAAGKERKAAQGLSGLLAGGDMQQDADLEENAKAFGKKLAV